MRPSHWLVLASTCLLTLTFTLSLQVALHAQSATEPPAPMPTAAIQAMITQVDALEKELKQAQALEVAARALKSAQSANDLVGVAMAQRSRARLLVSLGRPEEALADWRKAAQDWERVGDGPGRVEALGQAGVLTTTNPEEGKRLLAQALTLGKAETKRPLAAAMSLNAIGVTLCSSRRLDDASRFSETALAIQEKLAPASLNVIASLNNLGTVAYYRGDLAGAEAHFERSFHLAERLNPDSLDMADSLNGLGLLATDLTKSEYYYTRSLAIQEKLAPISLNTAYSLNNLGNVARSRSEFAKAEAYFKRSLALFERLAPDSLDLATSLNNLGILFSGLREYVKAEAYYQRSLNIRMKRAPNSRDVAASYINLGTVAGLQSEYVKAEGYFQRALHFQEKIVPHPPEMADSLNVAGTFGDLAGAEKYYKRALDIQEKIAPISLQMANALNNFGVVLDECGDLVQAEDYFQRALALYEKVAPNSLNIASKLNNLGAVALGIGDFPRAEDYYQRALHLLAKIDASISFPEWADSLLGLGNVAYRCHDLARAEALYQRSLGVYKKVDPESRGIATNLNNLGNVASDNNNLSKAEDYYQQSLKMREEIVSDSLDVAQSLNNLGTVAYDRGNLGTAEDYYYRAHAIREKLAPRSLEEVEIFNNLAEVLLRQKQFDTALPLLMRATQIVEDNRGHLTNPDARSLFFESYIQVFSLLRQTYIALHQPQNAFLTLERQRARSFADHLAERRFHFDSKVNDAPRALLKQQQALENQCHIVLTERSQLDPTDPKDQPAYAANDHKLDALAAQQRQVETQIRKASPRYAHLVYPTPLTFAQAQQSLPPGTLLLEYALDDKLNAKRDDKKVTLFTLTRSSFHTYSLPVSSRQLQQEVNAFRQGIANPGSNTFQPALAHRLYRQLLGMAQKEIAASRRLLICPDGVLHTLPFCALMPSEGQFLIEAKPLHFVASIGVYRELQQRRQGAHATFPHGLLALGDPLYPTTNSPAHTATVVKLVGSASTPPASTAMKSSSPVSASAPARFGSTVSSPTRLQHYVTLGGRLERVPQTGEQVRAIAHFCPPAPLVRVQAQATRSIVFREAGKARIVHFACHGLLDDHDPLASCLALTPEGAGDDGLLRAYDVLTRLNLDADLVVLAACQTGLGGKKGVSESEGVVGLTRAFGYAGAQSVLVSLWEIDAGSSTALMEAFYGQLRGGVSKDVALQEAQLALLRGKWKAGKGVSEPASGEWRRPYHWAAFLLTGDYQ